MSTPTGCPEADKDRTLERKFSAAVEDEIALLSQSKRPKAPIKSKSFLLSEEARTGNSIADAIAKNQTSLLDEAPPEHSAEPSQSKPEEKSPPSDKAQKRLKRTKSPSSTSESVEEEELLDSEESQALQRLKGEKSSEEDDTLKSSESQSQESDNLKFESNGKSKSSGSRRKKSSKRTGEKKEPVDVEEVLTRKKHRKSGTARVQSFPDGISPIKPEKKSKKSKATKTLKKIPSFGSTRTPPTAIQLRETKSKRKHKRTKSGGYSSEPELASSGTFRVPIPDAFVDPEGEERLKKDKSGLLKKKFRKPKYTEDAHTEMEVPVMGRRGSRVDLYQPPKSTKEYNKEMKRAKKEWTKFSKNGSGSSKTNVPSMKAANSASPLNSSGKQEKMKRDHSKEQVVVTDMEELAESVVAQYEDVPVMDTEDHDDDDSLEDCSMSVTEEEVLRRDESGRKPSIFNRRRARKPSRNDQKRAAIRIQALCKGFLLRKRLNAAGTIPTLLKQQSALRQLVSTETTYLASLSIITDVYYRPLMEFNRTSEEARKSLPIPVIIAIFRNIEAIQKLHQSLLTDVKASLESWPFTCKDIATLLLRFAGSLTVYIQYAEEAPASEETLRFYKQKPPLSSFLSKTYNERRHAANLPPRASIPDLGALLAIPYKHLAKDWNACSLFFHATPSTYPDYFSLADAVAIMGQLRRLVWNIVEEGINKRKMTILATKIQSNDKVAKPIEAKPRTIELNRRDSLKAHDIKQLRGQATRSGPSSPTALSPAAARSMLSTLTSKKEKEKEAESDSQKPFELYTPHRKLVRNGSLNVDGKKRHVFLFSDVCLILEVVHAHSSKFETVFDLQGATLHSKSVSMENNTQSFSIRSNDGADFSFTEPLTSDSGDPSWMQSFEDIIVFMTDKIFGASLATLCERESNAIPSLVLHIIQSLNKNITRPGLFQTPANPKAVQALRDPAAHRKLNNCNPHDIIGLLVMYLEQLPDQIIPFDPRDPLFQASRPPDADTIVKWMENWVKEIPMYNKNLLEFIVTFLSKVWARSASNGVSSIDLAVVFGPLLIKPEEISLVYCFKMPRIIRIVQVVIERAGDLFMTADDSSNPLPLTLEEFISADQFGQWWRDFRQKKPYFIRFITTNEVIEQLVQFILLVSDGDDVDGRNRTQHASLAYGVLVNDGVVSEMFQNTSLLDIVFSQFNGQAVSEKANKHFCDFVEILLRGNPEGMCQYFAENDSMCRKLVSSIGSGNFCNMILSISESWQANEHLHRVIVMWSVHSIVQFLDSNDDSDILSNTVRFLRFLVRSTPFLTHPLSKKFADMLADKAFMRKVVYKTLFSDPSTNVSAIPFIIELLVQSKNRTPIQQVRAMSSILYQASDKMTEKEEFQIIQMQNELPTVVSCVLERHKDISRFLLDPEAANVPSPSSTSELNARSLPEILQDQEHNQTNTPPLGFYRFGLVKVVQAILVTNYPYANHIVASSGLISACLQLFFTYYWHSILHSVIAYIVRYIMAMGSVDLVDVVISKLKLHDQIVAIFNREEGDVMLDNLRGYLKMLAIAIKNSAIAEETLASDMLWQNFVSELLLREESKSNTSSEVALAKKRAAGTPQRTLTDQVEDKIG